MNDLFKVLDMSENEQFLWCAENAGFDLLDSTLADLAFRLRDEAKKEDEYKWWKACYIITHGKLDAYANVGDGHDAEYEVLKREPIVWIIAALKVKEQK